MDPCPFVRVLIGNIALKVTGTSKPARSGVHPSSSPCFCKIKLGKLPCRTATLPLLSPDAAFPEKSQQQESSITLAAVFDLAGKSIAGGGSTRLRISVYKGRRGATCGVSAGRLIGRVTVPLDFSGESAERSRVFHNGWIPLGKEKSGDGSPAQVHLTVRSDPDPRFVFEFGGAPETSPQIFQMQGSLRQPVFTCKFSCRPSGDLSRRSRSLAMEKTVSSKWLASFGSDRERPGKERKGWSVTVHDLSGAPVALAAMVTPFVASPGTDRVSSSNPGAWLILRPSSSSTWKPYARLEAWRVRDLLAFRFELHPDSSPSAAVLAETSISASKGGTFTVDLTGEEERFECFTPRGSADLAGMGLYPFSGGRGFVMSAAVGGEKRKKGRRVDVEVSAQQVACMEDAAAFVALAAAVELSVDACRPFSGRMKKELLGRSRRDSLM